LLTDTSSLDKSMLSFFEGIFWSIHGKRRKAKGFTVRSLMHRPLSSFAVSYSMMQSQGLKYIPDDMVLGRTRNKMCDNQPKQISNLCIRTPCTSISSKFRLVRRPAKHDPLNCIPAWSRAMRRTAAFAKSTLNRVLARLPEKRTKF
jgi:hypothetical protein